MADKASLQVIGFVLASVTAGIIVVAAALVHASAGGQFVDHRAPWQVSRTAGI
jgi:hypothetical protein